MALPEKSDKYLKSVVAFANTRGGKIIIGIDDKEMTEIFLLIKKNTVVHYMSR